MAAQTDTLDALHKLIQQGVSLTPYFRDYIVRRKEDIKYAVTYRAKLFGRLNNFVSKSDSAHFKTIQFRGSGSYYKGTQVGDVDEFDILVECRYLYVGDLPSYVTGPTSLVFVGEPQRTLSSTILQNELEGLLKALQDDSASITAIKRSGSSVKMTLCPRGSATARPIDFDFIVAIPCEKAEADGIWWVPNRGRGPKAADWVPSFTADDRRLADQMESDYPGYKMMIRFLKHIRDELELHKISSYGLECVVHQFFTKKQFLPNRPDVTRNSKLLGDLIGYLARLLQYGCEVPHLHRKGVEMLQYIKVTTRQRYAMKIQKAFRKT